VDRRSYEHILLDNRVNGSYIYEWTMTEVVVIKGSEFTESRANGIYIINRSKNKVYAYPIGEPVTWPSFPGTIPQPIEIPPGDVLNPGRIGTFAIINHRQRGGFALYAGTNGIYEILDNKLVRSDATFSLGDTFGQ
jgi:hypothetical protein